MIEPAQPPMAQPRLDGPQSLESLVHAAIASVDDPEYPGISIVDLGLLETLSIGPASADGHRVVVGLVPTFSGCPALAVIADDVAAAVGAVSGVEQVEVNWLSAPAWTVDRVSHDARVVLADSFTVAVAIGASPANCPRCGTATEEQSMFGPSRCRAVHRCSACQETVEVLRA